MLEPHQAAANARCDPSRTIRIRSNAEVLSVQLRIKIPAPVAAGALQGHDAAGEAKDYAQAGVHCRKHLHHVVVTSFILGEVIVGTVHRFTALHDAWALLLLNWNTGQRLAGLLHNSEHCKEEDDEHAVQQLQAASEAVAPGEATNTRSVVVLGTQIATAGHHQRKQHGEDAKADHSSW